MAESIESNERQRQAMVSDVAHELRTPLANVRGYLEAADDGVVPLGKELVRSLLEEATLLQRLIDDLQELALADAGKLQLHHDLCDVVKVARQVEAAYQNTAERWGVRLEVAAMKPVIVEGDAVRLRQALGNLVTNAIRYTSEGGRVRIAVERTDDTAIISVSDTGQGINAKHLPRLFERFYRADASRSRATGGSGLGLAITKHLVEAHGGNVTVVSTPGAGSTFTLRVPLAPTL